MKKCLVLFTFALMTNAFAKETTSNYYLNNKTYEVVQVNSGRISPDGKTATYYSYRDYKDIQINMEDYVKDVEEINGIKPWQLILVKVKKDSEKEYCQVWHLFENNKAEISCKSDQYSHNPGVRRPLRAVYVLNDITKDVVAEVTELDGFKKKDYVQYQGKKARIEVLFENGEALIQHVAGLGFFDTSDIMLKLNILRVPLSEISK